MIQICVLPDQQIASVVARWQFDEWGQAYAGATAATFLAEVTKSIQSETIPVIFVAMVGGTPVGTASIVFDDLPSRPDLNPWLASVFVDPAFRNQGIASQLVLTALSHAKKLGVRQLYLFTHDRADLYERLGWVIFDSGEFMNRQVDLMISRCDR